ncbi:SAF domain-containing protein [Gulosibacter chungangensis]|uniref:SAF domain-containing protein n=1 Tax=Gulosibacter chungangensis TaxID=979746 RepID=A0A7J5B9B0_9MICO|nr:SAF domain-containing protein [Gulosibacter chungangensis]KAB1641156.1 hypothetical protein F8O05_13055 [Gulosibacter chungangensis]
MSILRQRIRLDPRLLIGSVLVIASVLGVVWVVSAAKQTVPVYVAAVAIAQGDTISEQSLSLVEVPVAGSNELYLSPESLSDAAIITTRPIGAGEFIPLSALGAGDDASAPVVVAISGALPENVSTGVAVELWAAAPGERPGTYEPPVVLVQQAQVVRVLESQQLVNNGQVEVELRLPDADLAEVLTALTNGSRMHLVPVFQPVGE